MNNKKIENGVTMESRVLSCVGSVNFKDFTHKDLPHLLEVMEKKLLRCPFVENYYLIAHNETDTPHIHYVLELTGQKRLKTLLNDFVKMGYNRESVNIDKLGFLNSSLKYFLHLDDDSVKENKKIYRLEDIISNMPYEYLEDMINLEDDNLNTERLIQICIECDGNMVSIMKRLGLSTFHKWRNEIKIILDYEYSLRFARENERKRREEELLKELPF